jgi:hypothetical protein
VIPLRRLVGARRRHGERSPFVQVPSLLDGRVLGHGVSAAARIGVSAGVDCGAPIGSEFDEQAAAAADAFAGRGCDLDLAGEHGDPGAFVHLVIVEALTRGNQQGDRARIVGGGEDLRGVWSEVQVLDRPAVRWCSLWRSGQIDWR